MTVGFDSNFQKDLERVLQQEVLRRITAAVADEFAVAWDGEQLDSGALDGVAEHLLTRLHARAAAQLVLGLVRYMHKHGHINYCHEDRCLWEEFGAFEVTFPKKMDRCG